MTENRSLTTWQFIGLGRATPVGNDVVLRLATASGAIREVPLTPIQLSQLGVQVLKELDYMIASLELGP